MRETGTRIQDAFRGAPGRSFQLLTTPGTWEGLRQDPELGPAPLTCQDKQTGVEGLQVPTCLRKPSSNKGYGGAAKNK